MKATEPESEVMVYGSSRWLEFVWVAADAKRHQRDIIVQPAATFHLGEAHTDESDDFD